VAFFIFIFLSFYILSFLSFEPKTIKWAPHCLLNFEAASFIFIFFILLSFYILSFFIF